MKTLSLFLAALLALHLSGCVNPIEKSKDSAKADDGEYILVEGLGSRIPRRVRVDQLSLAALQGAHPTAKVTGEEQVRELLARPFPVSRGMGGNP